MINPQVVLLVKFKSPLSIEEVREVAEARSPEFRKLEGLQQKYYLQDAATGEIAGLYLWESKETLDDYRKSALRASIAAAYKVEGEPRVEVFEVLMPLRENVAG
ncbi:MAG TPA: YdhR family protein [Parvularculaceae bacterium]|nr:YdhR family protein [Caulobacterales bacterium]HPE31098.1 YdhR family protein [Parvularculaceae bacterium]HRX40410.1 YdhR family protein [Parvularculaceae bacterium]